VSRYDYDDYQFSLEPGCLACGGPYEYCDCVLCDACGKLIDNHGRYAYERLTPAVCCCSTTCLLGLGAERRLTTCIETPVIGDPS